MIGTGSEVLRDSIELVLIPPGRVLAVVNRHQLSSQSLDYKLMTLSTCLLRLVQRYHHFENSPLLAQSIPPASNVVQFSPHRNQATRSLAHSRNG